MGVCVISGRVRRSSAGRWPCGRVQSCQPLVGALRGKLRRPRDGGWLRVVRDQFGGCFFLVWLVEAVGSCGCQVGLGDPKEFIEAACRMDGCSPRSFDRSSPPARQGRCFACSWRGTFSPSLLLCWWRGPQSLPKWKMQLSGRNV